MTGVTLRLPTGVRGVAFLAEGGVLVDSLFCAAGFIRGELRSVSAVTVDAGLRDTAVGVAFLAGVTGFNAGVLEGSLLVGVPDFTAGVLEGCNGAATFFFALAVTTTAAVELGFRPTDADAAPSGRTVFLTPKKARMSA